MPKKAKTCVSHFEPRSSLPGLPPTAPSHHGQAPEGPLNFYSVILVGKPSTSYSYLTFFSSPSTSSFPDHQLNNTARKKSQRPRTGRRQAHFFCHSFFFFPQKGVTFCLASPRCHNTTYKKKKKESMFFKMEIITPKKRTLSVGYLWMSTTNLRQGCFYSFYM